MACEYCNGLFKHDSRCPNFKHKKASKYCSICDEGIYDGNEYIENRFGEYAHWDCIRGAYDLIKWLGYSIKTMEETDEEFY